MSCCVGISTIRGCLTAWGVRPHAEWYWICGLPRHDGGKYPVPAVGDVDWCSGESFVVLEVARSYDSASRLGC